MAVKFYFVKEEGGPRPLSDPSSNVIMSYNQGRSNVKGGTLLSCFQQPGHSTEMMNKNYILLGLIKAASLSEIFSWLRLCLIHFIVLGLYI